MGPGEIAVISGDRYAEYGYLSPETGALRILAGDPLRANLTFQGTFGRMGRDLVALYRAGGDIYLQSERFKIRLHPEMTASITQGPGNARTLEITSGGESLLVVAYTATPRWELQDS